MPPRPGVTPMPPSDVIGLDVELDELRRGEPGGRVRPERVERDVAEVEQASVADDDVQPDGHHREDGHHDHRVDARKAVEDRNLEQEALVVRLLNEERVRDRDGEHGHGQGPPPPTSRQDVERVHDREQDDRRWVRSAQRQHHEDHERRDHERRDRALEEWGLALPPRACVLHADRLEEAEDAVVEASAVPLADHQPPSGVCSPRSPCGRKTRMRMRIPKTMEFVQAEPGACHERPSL